MIEYKGSVICSRDTTGSEEGFCVSLGKWNEQSERAPRRHKYHEIGRGRLKVIQSAWRKVVLHG